jgi:predicted O-methyltransferase YrrM
VRKVVEIIPPELEAYLEGLLPARHPLIVKMEKEAKRRGFPIMGPLVGSFLGLLVRAVGAREVLELGSGFGYSAFWLAQALPEGGRVVAFERDPKNIKKAEAYLGEAGLAERVVFKAGDALELMESEPGPFDIIFNDVDKDCYPQVPPRALPRLRAGGLLVTDNALWYGRVAAPPEDEWTAGVQAYNRMVSSDEALITTIVPIRDGLAVSLKLAGG